MTENLRESVAASAGRGAVIPGRKPMGARRLGRFYEGALDDAERADFIAAQAVEGLDEEIALLRLRLKQAVAQKPADLALMLHGIEILARLVVNRYRLPATSVEALSAAMRAGLAAAGLPAGEGVAAE